MLKIKNTDQDVREVTSLDIEPVYFSRGEEE